MLKKKFGVYGEMKSFFDLISTRGILFITYVGPGATRAVLISTFLLIAAAARPTSTTSVRQSLRETACKALTWKAGRSVCLHSIRQYMGSTVLTLRRLSCQIDVHYSLPKDDESPNRHCDREKNQGTLRIVLHNSRVALQEYELDRMFRTFGAIKGIYFSGGDPAKERLLEFYDIRAMGDAYDRMQDKEYPGGGKLEVFYDWDVKDIPLTCVMTAMRSWVTGVRA